jgi:hypothetical protein
MRRPRIAVGRSMHRHQLDEALAAETTSKHRNSTDVQQLWPVSLVVHEPTVPDWRFPFGLEAAAHRARPPAQARDYARFEMAQPNEMWQSDFIHWRLAGGTESRF